MNLTTIYNLSITTQQMLYNLCNRLVMNILAVVAFTHSPFTRGSIRELCCQSRRRTQSKSKTIILRANRSAYLAPIADFWHLNSMIKKSKTQMILTNSKMSLWPCRPRSNQGTNLVPSRNTKCLSTEENIIVHYLARHSAQ